MARITKTVIEQSARAITCFIGSLSQDTKKGNHPILLTGGIDVEVEIKAGLEDKLIINAKVGNCVVYKDKITYQQIADVAGSAESLYSVLVFKITEALYDNALIADFSLMKLISAVGNRHVTETTLELPAGYTVELNSDAIIILNADNKRIELQEFNNNGYALSPALCIPKTIATHMAAEDFSPFTIL